MGFDIEKLDKSVRFLQQLPGIAFRKRADKQTPLFTPAQVELLEETILEDIYELTVDAKEYFEKREADRQKKAAKAAPAEKPPAEPAEKPK